MTSRRWALLSSALATLASGAWLVVPSYSGVEAVATTAGTETGRAFSATLLDVNGPRVLPLLAFPIAVGLLALVPLPRSLRFPVLVTASVLLSGFVVFGAFSIGLFYVPAAVAMCFATGRALEATAMRRVAARSTSAPPAPD